MKDKNILVIGSYIVALVMETNRLPIQGETLAGKNFREVHGGKGSNQAVQAARLGAKVTMLSKVGNDQYGKSFLQLCDQEKINSKHVFTDKKLPTATGFIICSENGHNMITIDMAALNNISENNIDSVLANINESTTVLIQFEMPLKMVLYAARQSKKKGATTIVNPAPAQNLGESDLSFIDYLTPNEHEARVCSGLDPNSKISDEDAAKKLLELGCKNVILTLGEKGCLWVNKDRTEKIPAFKLSQVVDSTGAGDAFNAGFATALSEKKSITDALKFANACGALSCTKWDTIPSLHYRKEVEDFINKSKP